MTAAATRTNPEVAAPIASPAPILAIIPIGYFMILLDISVIFTGLPSIRVAETRHAPALSRTAPEGVTT